jgi:hypothetical protein
MKQLSLHRSHVVLKMLSLYTYTFLASAEEVLIYPLKLFWGVTLVNLVLQTTPHKNITRNKIG